MENPQGRTKPLLLAGAALALYVLALFFPLHIIGRGEFGNAFPEGAGTRLTVGFLIGNFTVPIIITLGMGIAWRGRALLAAGVLLASGLVAVSEAVRAPFYALVRLQPIVLLALWGVAGLLLLAAAWLASRDSGLRSRSATLPPPPDAPSAPTGV